MRWLPQTYPLGQLWSYNNASFYIAGRLIEVITGKPYAQVAKEELLDPLGMTNTGFRLTDPDQHNDWVRSISKMAKENQR